MWKDRWELILTEDLANVEVQLFDAEAYADRYKFKSSREKLTEIEKKINEIDAELESITNQLNELLETEEASRKNVEELRPAIKEMERKSTRLNSSHVAISYAVFCLKKKK